MHVVVSERSLQMNGISTTELYESECSILAKSLGYEGVVVVVVVVVVVPQPLLHFLPLRYVRRNFPATHPHVPRQCADALVARGPAAWERQVGVRC